MHVPGWHARTQEARAADELAVVGITQEQHPERCRLFAQWHGIDWPILWDPFNLTGAPAVPRLALVDEHGVVRATRPDPETWRQEFLERSFPAPAAPLPPPARPDVRALAGEPAGGLTERERRAVEAVLWGGDGALDDALAALAASAAAAPEDARRRFRLGVAHRLRYETGRGRPGDFQSALDAWRRALALEPNHYVWRRRIQQYGPRLDKPYPFYGWIAEAREAIRARGEEPIALRARLTGAEVVPPAEDWDAREEEREPDPEGRIRRDGGELLAVETAVATTTSGDAGAGRVHVVLRPRAERDAHWNNEAEPLHVWIDVPAGWRAERRLFTVEGPHAAVSTEPRGIDFEVERVGGAGDGADGGAPPVLTGYALFYACEGRDGTCVYRRRDFEVALPAR